MPFAHRKEGYKILKGSGLEIGALHQPAKIPPECKVEYCDVMSKSEAIRLFHEVESTLFVEPSYIADLDKEALAQFEEGKFDFVILNHVIEHLANPIRALSELFRVVKEGGYVVLSCPDKDYTFDKKRKLTEYEHLLNEYRADIREVTDEHYIDFLEGVHPEVFESTERYLEALNSVRNRKEHAHVWTSSSFQDFLDRSLKVLKIEANCLFVSTSNENSFEHFSVWVKNKTNPQYQAKKQWWNLFGKRA